MLRKFKPIPHEEFPIDKEVIEGTNCLAFALGLRNPKWKKRYVLKMTAEPMETVFLNKVKKLGFNPKKFKKIDTEKEREATGYIIRVYGFVPEETLDEGLKYDFHVIRREPNGQWVHKPDFRRRPRALSDKDWKEIFYKYGDEFVSFAVDA